MSPSCTRAKNGPPMSHPPRDGGFTLIELLVTMSVMGIMMAIAVSGWSSWAKASEQSGTAREFQSFLRNTQQRAVTEGRSLCVVVDMGSRQYASYYGACGAHETAAAQGPVSAAGNVYLSTVQPAVPPALPTCSDVVTGTTSVSFNPRGGAVLTTGEDIVGVRRNDSSKCYIVSIEGLTGRVELTG